MENKETVLVTGGSGFIASHCIIQLAAAGYQVKATVRDLSRTNKLNQTLLNGLEKYEGKSDLSVDWQVTNLSSEEGWDESDVRMRLCSTRSITNCYAIAKGRR